MEHQTPINEANTGALPKLIAVIAIVVGLAAIGAYVVYGSGMWNPPPAKSAY
ncbi:MAG TPA: hypothetical protein VG501_10035 [Rhizomicrobium sp.]|nr:hypothetical protein [Rhizomicrobium sp.]